MDAALSTPANAVALIGPTPVATADAGLAPPTFVERLKAMPLKQKGLLGAGVAIVIAAIVGLALWSAQGDYRPLFTGLSDKDGGAVIAQLSGMNVPYKHDGGGTILVPAGQVYELRMKLASAGLPKGAANGTGSSSTVGFELMDKSSIGQTQFSERLNHQRALEGELTRTITALADVADARVHLAMPQQNGFFREQQKPSASVMLTLRGGRTLDRAQVAGIVHLVSSSVPELNPKAVSVIDQTGSLLSQTDVDPATGLDGQQLRYKQQIEVSLNKRIFDLLEPVVGRDNLRSTVAADIDFNQVESTAEEFRPNQGTGANASVRSSQSSESNTQGNSTPTGVPGAATNQPPVPATAPVNGASAPLQTAGNGAGGGQSRREQTTNFELDKTVRVTRNAIGAVKRLNAALVVNHRSSTDAKGKTTTAPIQQAELDRLTELVKEAVGFNAERGDSVKVVTAPFVVDKPEVVEVPLWKQPWALDLMRSAMVPLAFVMLALIAAFGMVRPALTAAMPPPPPEAPEPEPVKIDEVADEVEMLPGLENMPKLETPLHSIKLDRARLLAKENPVAVANILRDWISGGA